MLGQMLNLMQIHVNINTKSSSDSKMMLNFKSAVKRNGLLIINLISVRLNEFSNIAKKIKKLPNLPKAESGRANFDLHVGI